jgi:tRNA(Arg) A34 adenosine deaminase TadA
MLSEADLGHLRRAIQLAGAAREHGNHPFGALLVSAGGELLAEAENAVVTDRDCTAHAELNLVRLVSRRFDREALAGSTLFSSTEPCAMCAGAIHWSGIGRVVYALSEERLYRLTGTTPPTSRWTCPAGRCSRGLRAPSRWPVRRLKPKRKRSTGTSGGPAPSSRPGRHVRRTACRTAEPLPARLAPMASPEGARSRRVRSVLQRPQADRNRPPAALFN